MAQANKRGRRVGALQSDARQPDIYYESIPVGGYCATADAPAGSVSKEYNISSENGVLGSRAARRYRTWKAEGSVCVGTYQNRLFRTEGKNFYYDDTLVEGMVLPLDADQTRRFEVFDSYIVIMPDKYYYRPSTGAYGSLEANVTFVGSLELAMDGVYVKESAWDTTPELSACFRPGDWVYLRVDYLPHQNTIPDRYEQYLLVDQTRAHSIGFEPETVQAPYDIPEGTITIQRLVPALEGMCVCHDRLFGYVGNTVYASRKGDIFNWAVLGQEDGDAYEKNTIHSKPFTACTVYRGKPTFFAEQLVSVLYGEHPEDFVLVDTPLCGVMAKASDSLTCIDDRLYYLSSLGVTVYDGDEAQVISDALGVRLTRGVGGSDGRNYYLSVVEFKNGMNYDRNYLYHVKSGQWSCEDQLAFSRLVYCDQVLYGVRHFNGTAGLYAVSGNMRRFSGDYEVESNSRPLNFSLEFADFTFDKGSGMACRAYLKRLLLQVELGENAFVRVLVSCDGGAFCQVGQVDTVGKACVTFPIPPNRCHRCRVRLEGQNQFRLHGIGQLYESKA